MDHCPVTNRSDILKKLKQRGYISQLTDPKLQEKLDEPITLYAGFDPTAQSLHIGHLLQIMLLSWFQRYGHNPIAVMGGATAMIGDPSGKNTERNLMDEQTIATNQNGIERQLRHFLDFDQAQNKAELLNNADWIGRFGFIEFLRDVGKHFRIGDMLGKESVRKRMESHTGLSFTEFSYPLLQSYDFLHLSREKNCRLQVGGDDQWGNITAGIELIRKLDAKSAFGLTTPLITTTSGQKFGKTEAGTIWLDADKTSPYEFYQYWIRVDDRDVISLLNLFTFLTEEQISKLENQVRTEPQKREAQHVLADELTRLVHGPEPLTAVQNASQVLFGKTIEGLLDRDLNDIFTDVPSTTFPLQSLTEGIDFIEALCKTTLCQSRGEAKRQIKAGGIYLNNIRVNEDHPKLTLDSLASESMVVIRSGKKNYHLLKFENHADSSGA